MNQTIGVNITPQSFQPTLHYSQGDVGRVFVINVTDYDIPTGATVTCVATKPSGMGFTVSGTVSGNSVTFTSTAEMTDEWGRFPAEIRIASGNTLLGTANFLMIGEKDPHPASTIDGTQEELIPQLTLLVNRVEAAAESVHDLTVSATTLTAGSDATATYDSTNNSIAFGIPRGADGDVTRSEFNDLKSELSDAIIEKNIPKGTIVDGEYVKFEDGTFLPYSGWSRTDYIDCSMWTQVKISTNSNYNAFYDENKNYISQARFITADTYIDVPNNAHYIAISATTVIMATLVITAKAKSVVYQINEKISDIESVVDTYEKREPSSLIDGYLISDTGSQIASSDWVCTDYLDLPFNEVSSIFVRGTFYGTGGCAIFDEDRRLLQAINGNNVASYGGVSSQYLQTISVPYIDGAKFIRISGWKSRVSDASDLWVSGNTSAGAFERIFDLEADVKEVKANISTSIAESKVLVIGDSISTDAYGNYPKWVTVLKNAGFFPSDVLNSSQHATGFVARYDNQPNDFITRLKAIQNPSQYDLVVVFGGINDYIQNVPMGSETGTDYTVSFKPAVNEFFNYLIQNFTQARLCVLLPLRTYATWKNSVDEYQQAYGDYIKQVAKSYCLPILNLTEDSGFCPYISTFSDMWTLLPEGFQSHDGVHPNEEYERRFLAPMIKGFLQGLM